VNKVKLHLGCGKRFLPGYVHIDVDTYPHIDYQADIRQLSMCDTESVDLIYNCGTFEYFDRFEAVEVLSEWRRALKDGGTLRISVPNFDSVVQVYLQNGKDLDGEGILGLLYGRIEIETAGGDTTLYHKTVYDFHSLEKLLNLAGFENVRAYDWEEVLPPDYDDYSMAYMPYKDKSGIQMSLNIECTKGERKCV